MARIHFRTEGTTKTGKAMCNGKSKNTRIISRMVTCEDCLEIMRYHGENKTEAGRLFGWDYLFGSNDLNKKEK